MVLNIAAGARTWGDARLQRPPIEAIDLAPLKRGDRQVLVPTQAPVRLDGLVEQQRAHREGVTSDDPAKSRITRD
jgi:hypothetical protein